MLKEDFTTIFPSAKIESILTNSEFDFKIELAKLPDSKFQIIFTHGLNKFQQDVDEKHADFNQIELFMSLPEYWDIKSDSWPVEILNRIAAAPQKNNTWYSPGDTVKLKEAISHTFEGPSIDGFKHFIMSEPMLHTDLAKETLTFKYLAIFPIFEYEFDYKMRNSATVLIKKLKKKGLSEKFDVYRKSVCRKRILGMF